MPIKPSPEIEALIRAAAAKHGIPFELLYSQVKQESAFSPLAVSHCGARGLMQIMPATWRDITGKDSDSNNDIFDAEKNLDAGAAYARRMYRAAKNMITTLKGVINDCTDEDYRKIGLAAYNGGLGYMIKAVNLCIQDGHPIKWETVAPHLADPREVVRGHNPDEKQMTDYVEKIWTNYKGLTEGSNGC
jgi:soluble lytic murein transglycosylase-like protein